MAKDIKIVLYDTDKDYIESLGKYLAGQSDVRYDMRLFTDYDTMVTFCDNEDMDMLIIAEYLLKDYYNKVNYRKNNESSYLYVRDSHSSDGNDVPDKISNDTYNKNIYHEEINGHRLNGNSSHNICSVIVMVEDKNVEKIDGLQTVYRYQPVDVLISSILNIYIDSAEEDNGREYERVSRCKLISIYSPIGRCGKTRLAYNLAMELGRRHLKTLFLNLEAFSNLDLLLEYEDEPNLSNLIYHYISKSGNFDIKAESIVRSNGYVDYIPPVICVSDLTEINSDMWKEFIQALTLVKAYDVVVIDLSDIVQNYFTILEESDKIILPVLKEESSRYKLRRFRDYICKSDYKLGTEDIIEINMDNESNRNSTMGRIVEEIESICRE